MLGLTALGQSPAAAQFEVPFGFTVTGLAMPSGAYKLTALGTGAVSLTHLPTGKRVMAASCGSFKANAESKLVFQKIGSESWLESADLGGLQAKWREMSQPHAAETVPAPVRVVLYAAR